MKPFMDHL